ncbi:MAG: NAD-dependent epimerase/dehydratase family protein [Fibrobacter sp.]|nr:NAD-dependent epimerase/dehydratase family protein [Fibrobacter sp.]
MNRIIVTGANGFIGRHLVKELLSRGHDQIIPLFRSRNVPPGLADLHIEHGSFGDPELLTKTLLRGDTVFHLGCTSFPAISESSIVNDIEENIIGTVRLIKACCEAKISRFIFISSGGTVYGKGNCVPFKESDPLLPVNSHGVMKTTVENYIRVHSNLAGLKYVIVRVSNPFGIDEIKERPQGIIDTALRRILINKKMDIWGDGQVVRDFLFIDDLTRALEKIYTSGIYNEVINIGSGSGTTIKDALIEVENSVGKKLDLNHLPPRPFDLEYNVLDIGKAKKLLGWVPSFKLSEGIIESLRRLTQSYSNEMPPCEL